jgi:LacI family gluconate utilization system Gnt-I transcriptional repressor
MTVVRVLREPGKVAPATRSRVRAALEELQYTPDLVARSLVSRRTGTVGAIVPTLSNSLIADVVQGMSDELAVHEMQLLVGASGFSADREESLVRNFLARRVDALYLTGTCHTPTTVRMIVAAGLPVVEGGNIPEKPIDYAIGSSNAAAAAAIVRHLIRRYGENVGFVGGSPVDNDRMRDRRLGYESEIRRAGARPRPEMTVEVPISMEGGRKAICQMLSHQRAPRAVFFATDVLAAGAVFECARRGVRVPDELAIAGYDDLDIAGEIVPALTTVRVPRYEIGRQTARFMHLSLTGRRPKGDIHDIGFELVLRESA